ncbi:MAG: hypothetical protein H6672_16720 [Anaerolineaceae bacterium]|nr:hypothetical protein [Anaerolineaceae bacterium]
MSDGIDERIDYVMMEEMSRLFNEAARQIEEMNGEMVQIANTLESGALLGETGESFAQALRVDLANSLGLLQQKMEELVGDINGVIALKRDAVQDAASRFA